MVYQQTYTLSNFGAHVSRLPHVHIFFCCSNFDVLISFGAREITKWQLLKIIKIRVCNALFAFAWKLSNLFGLLVMSYQQLFDTICSSRKYLYLSPGKVFVLTSPPPPHQSSWISNKASYTSFYRPPPHPQEIANPVCRGVLIFSGTAQ